MGYLGFRISGLLRASGLTEQLPCMEEFVGVQVWVKGLNGSWLSRVWD